MFHYNVNITKDKRLLDQRCDAAMLLNGIFASVQVQSAAGARAPLRAPLPSPLLPLPRLVLSSVLLLLLLNAHYCWSGRAP